MADRPAIGRRRFLLNAGATGDVAAAQPAVAVIAPSCLAMRGVACMSCRDACAPGAIRFALALGGARPRIDLDACTGCTDCVRSCPVGAIAMAPRDERAHG